MALPELEFRTIDLTEHAELSISFRRDSFVCSFGTDARFVETDADGRGYLEWLSARISRFPEGHVHAWQGGAIIGQIEMVVSPTSGYVNLFYLRPEARGLGFGTALQDYAVKLMQRGQVAVANLRVSPTNPRAIKFYARHGWTDLGAPAGEEHVHVMELIVPKSET
jgi:ribosomal protein S18 acetylase RimI-like enzyme